VNNDHTLLCKASPEDTVYGPIPPEMLSSLVHSLVHDIGNPMTSIISYSGLIEQAANLSLSAEQLSPYASKISGESWKVMKLVDLLLLSLSERREVSNFSLPAFKQTLIQRSSSRYGLGEADLLLKGFDSEISVKGDLDQMVLLSCEIISNALGAFKALENNSDDGCSVTLDTKIQNDHIILTYFNSSPKHNVSLNNLYNLAISEFPRFNKPAGIGLFSLARTIKRWGGEVEISEFKNLDSSILFSTAITLPLAS